MVFFEKFHSRFRFYLLPLIFIIIALYFTYHLIQGERGIFRLFDVNEEIKQAEVLVAQSKAQKEQMEAKVRSLSPQSVNVDMLDEAGRQELGVIAPSEYVIFE